MSQNSSTSSSRTVRRYLAVLAGMVALGLGLVVGLNVLVDPWWLFTHANALNRVQEDIDERAQKTNWLEARAGQFDTALLGSSRVTYVDRRDFAPLRVFNYGFNAMLPGEYRPYLDHFVAVNGKAPELVFLGVDFFTSGVEPVFAPRPPEPYLAQAGSLRYATSVLLSLDTAAHSLRSLATSLGLTAGGKPERYDRNDIRFLGRAVTGEMRDRNLLRTLEQYRSRIYGPRFAYDAALPERWRELRRAYPKTRFVVFTTPESAPLFSLMVKQGHLREHERWLADLAEVFGEVWDFAGLNSVTLDPTNYLDAHHFEPRVGRLIVDRLLDRPLPAEHADFGRRVTPTNLQAHLDAVRGRLGKLDPDPIRTARERARATGAVSPG